MFQPSLVPAVSLCEDRVSPRQRLRFEHSTTASSLSVLARTWCFAWFVLALTWPSPATAEPQSAETQSLSQELKQSIFPLLTRYCLECHDSETKEGEIDLEQFVRLDDVRRELGAWQKLLAQLQIGEMPPTTSKQPSVSERETLIRWTKQFLRTEALANAGDPGPVVLRRLSNAEYAYSLRDLTQVDALDPTREFPVDGAAGEGFTNAGDALVMSPTLLTKYLDAAREAGGNSQLLLSVF
jgi:hypothetical protein